MQSARAAHDLDAAKLAEVIHLGRAGDRQDAASRSGRSRDEEIEAAVAVVVAPGGAGGPVAERDAGFLGDVGEGAVVVVVVEAVLAEVADVDVGPAVVVVVADGHAEAPAVVGHAGFCGDVGEGAVVVVVEERGVRRRGFAGQRVEGGAVDEIDVEPAIVVVIEQRDA